MMGQPLCKLNDIETFEPKVDLPLDAGIRHAVLVLRSGGVETFESCEGGPGHSSPHLMIRFYGSAWAGYRAFAQMICWLKFIKL